MIDAGMMANCFGLMKQSVSQDFKFIGRGTLVKHGLCNATVRSGKKGISERPESVQSFSPTEPTGHG